MKNVKKAVITAAQILDEKKAENIAIFDLGGKSSLCDYVVLATATSAPHLEALESEVSTRLKQDSVYKINREGGQSPYWRVSDYGAFLLHIMTEPARNFYALDKLFSFAKLLTWNEEEAKPKQETLKTAKKPAAKTAKKTVKKSVKKTAVKKPAKKTAKKPAKSASVKKPLKNKKTAKKSVIKKGKKGKK